jgi:TBC1 domain family member 14
MSVFQPGGAYFDSLRVILEAFTCYRPDIGYVQGMSFVAGVFLLYLEPYEAFMCLANILSQPFFLVFYRMKADEVVSILGILEALLQDHVPAVARHFKEIHLMPELFAVDWFLTIFSRSFPLHFTCRIWDCFFLEGDVRFLFLVSIGLLSILADDLVKMDFEGCLRLLGKFSKEIDVDKLFQIMSSIKISPRRWKNLVQYDMRTISIIQQQDEQTQ